MKITSINFENIKTSYFNNAAKSSFIAPIKISLNTKPAFDTFRGKNSQTERAIELHSLLNGKVKDPGVIIKEFSQYTGDDYETAKILAGSLKQDKSGLHFSLSKEDKEKIKWLEPECPYLQAYVLSLD